MTAAVELRDVVKSFGPTRVLRGVSLALEEGEVHVLAGANGAGKSTLIKILGGAIVDFEGELRCAGVARRFRDPADARRAGVSVIHQELSLVPSMSVVDNVALGREPRWIGNRAAQRRSARAAIADLGLDVDVDAAVETLPVSQQQLVEIARALDVGAAARVLIMDEPTSALDEPEAEALFDRVRALRDRGCAVLFVTHRLEEIHALADRITVLRDGVVAASAPARDLDRDALVAAMLGRELRAEIDAQPLPVSESRSTRRLLEVRGLDVEHATRRGRLEVREATLSVAPGEVVGVAGVAGSGASALLHAVFGSHPGRVTGEVLLEGRSLPRADPTTSVARGLALVPSDRKSQGLVLSRSVRENAALSALRRWTRLGLVRRDAELRDVSSAMEAMHVVAASLDVEVGALSGGNQQKVILARCLLAQPKVLLLDEPTRGVDVGAKAEIHRRLRALAREGTALLVSTSEIEDLLGLCDRVVVMHRGAIVAGFSRAEASRDRVLRATMGHADA